MTDASGLGYPSKSSPAWRWAPAPPGAPLHCVAVHAGAGRFDESARRLSHEELVAARMLVADGHDVRSQPERRGRGPSADLLVCGQPVEVKSWAPVDERGAPPGARSVFNKLVSAMRQAPHAVLVDTGSGLTEEAARRGMAEFAARSFHRLDTVRIVGPDFDLTWRRERVLARSAAPPLDRGAPVTRPGSRPDRAPTRGAPALGLRRAPDGPGLGM